MENIMEPINCVFGLIFTKETNQFSKTPLVFMQLRWNGRFGFPGGKVDPGELNLHALMRKLKQEIRNSL